jgi:hypothetical protein
MTYYHFVRVNKDGQAYLGYNDNRIVTVGETITVEGDACTLSSMDYMQAHASSMRWNIVRWGTWHCAASNWAGRCYTTQTRASRRRAPSSPCCRSKKPTPCCATLPDGVPCQVIPSVGRSRCCEAVP